MTVADVDARVLGRKSGVLASEFGLKTKEDVDVFLNSTWKDFELVCLTEYFDECLVMMRRRFNWNMLDITYLRLLDSADTQYVYGCSFVMSLASL